MGILVSGKMNIGIGNPAKLLVFKVYFYRQSRLQPPLGYLNNDLQWPYLIHRLRRSQDDE